jgi:hypothetical protein
VLILLQKLVRLRVEETGMRIERAQHAGNGAVVQGAIEADAVSEVRLHQVEYLGEGMETGTQILLGGSRGRNGC